MERSTTALARQACPHCGSTATRLRRSPANLLRGLASLLVFPFYLGVVTDDDPLPGLRLSRRCLSCGSSHRGRTVWFEIGRRRRQGRSPHA